MRQPSAEPAAVNEPPAMPSAVVIAPTAVFTTAQVQQMFGLRQSSLRREIREGRLRVSKRCGKYFFIGEMLLDWLRDGISAESPPRPKRPDVHPPRQRAKPSANHGGNGASTN